MDPASSGTPITVQDCIESMRYACLTAAQYVETQDIRRQSGSWSLRSLIPGKKKKLGKEAIILYEQLMIGSEKIEAAGEAFKLRVGSGAASFQGTGKFDPLSIGQEE